MAAICAQKWHAIVAAFGLVTLYTAYYRRHRDVECSTILSSLRDRLPRSLKAWRAAARATEIEAIWKELNDFFTDRGFTLWKYAFLTDTLAPQTEVGANGYQYFTVLRGFASNDPGSATDILDFRYSNALHRAARLADGRDVVIRVMAIGSDGRKELDILKLVARGLHSIISMNHTLPLLDLIDLDDITFGIFPKAGVSLLFAYNFWANNSRGDVLDMIIQCLEALVFLHPVGIAHRDAFKDNFVVEWMPETMSMDHMPASRPRVYIIDFEVAVYFPPEVPVEERLCEGPPMGGSFPDTYGRPMPPEVASGKPYDPFKLDVWQLGWSFQDFKTTVPDIDAILASMTDPDPSTRPSAYDAMKGLIDAISEIPPKILDVTVTKSLAISADSDGGSPPTL